MAEANKPGPATEEFLALVKSYTPTHALKRERELLSGRYRILTSQPLPELESAFAKAYGVQDEQDAGASLYALVFDNTIPQRRKNIAALKDFRHPQLVTLIDEGVVEMGALGEAHSVAVLERPQGKRLSDLLAKRMDPVPESVLIQDILRPLTEVLVAFNALGISHNRINLSNVYLHHQTIQLGECISEPSGFSQDPVFEAVDRLLANPLAKPDFAIEADGYALAVLAMHLSLGFKPFASLDKASLITQIATKGPYHTLAIEWDLPDGIQDLLRGALSDTHPERAHPDTIASWLAGKRFHLILPSLPREASHGFEFAGQMYFNRKAIACSLFEHWQEGRAVLFENKLFRWLETAAHKPEAAEAVSRITGVTGGTDSMRSERYNNELLGRIIMVLDPSGPLRFKNLSLCVDGIGPFLAHAYLSGQQEDVQTLAQILESDLPGFWIDQQKDGADYNPQLSKLQRLRSFLRMTSLGFGMERCLYELNPSLPCQSPLVKHYHVTGIVELLSALDTIAPQRASQAECMDRHMAAFLASKLDISKEIRVHEIDILPDLAIHPKLVALKLLARAQYRAGDPSLKGLSYWVAYRLLPLLDRLHTRALRQRLQTQLQTIAARGLLQSLADAFLSPDIFAADHHGFQKAMAAYAAHGQQIAELNNNVHFASHARIAGRGIAQTVAYTICIATIYYTLKSYFPI